MSKRFIAELVRPFMDGLYRVSVRKILPLLLLLRESNKTRKYTEESDSLFPVVVFTSFGSRISEMFHTLQSIRFQTCRPCLLVFVCTQQDLMNTDAKTRARIADAQKLGLQILLAKDLRSYKKLLPVLDSCYCESPVSKLISRKAFDKATHFITLDDDIFYRKNLVFDLLQASFSSKDAISFSTGMSFDLKKRYSEWELATNDSVSVGSPKYPTMPVGAGGICYPKTAATMLIGDSRWKKVAAFTDDIWFYYKLRRYSSGYLQLKGHTSKYFVQIQPTSKQASSLYTINRDGNNDRVLEVLFSQGDDSVAGI